MNRTSHELRCELRKFGFYNVTGLPRFDVVNDEVRAIQARKSDRGRWGQDGFVLTAVLDNFEVWRARKKLDEPTSKFLNRICPNGDNVQNPLSDGFLLDQQHIEWRFGDPYSDCDGKANIEPRPA